MAKLITSFSFLSDMASCKHQLNGKTSTTELLRQLEVTSPCSSKRKDNSTRLEPDIALIHDK